jgi:hypothetical protein
MGRTTRYRCKKSFRMDIASYIALEELAVRMDINVSELLRRIVVKELRQAMQSQP